MGIEKPAEQLLNKRLKIHIIDGRVMVGDFICLDKQGNIILYNTVERLVRDDIVEEKPLGQVLVPVEQRKRIEIEVCGQRDKEMVERLLQQQGMEGR